MAISASLHHNILLLNQLVPPSDDFKKVFREVILSTVYLLLSTVLFYIYNNIIYKTILYNNYIYNVLNFVQFLLLLLTIYYQK